MRSLRYRRRVGHVDAQLAVPSERGRLVDAQLVIPSARVGLSIAQKGAAEWCCLGVVGLGIGGRGSGEMMLLSPRME